MAISQARVCHVSREEAQTSSAAVLSMLNVYGFFACALFDSGASHSFVTSHFVKSVGLVVHPLEYI